ncbi:MAG: hypothetical protein EGS36_01155 [Akkermansia muciniphila]|nr:hypothetical protein [Akkermansia muciniphila]
MRYHGGTNNTGQYKGRQTPQETAEGTREIASRVHRLHPATEIILLHIFPGGKRRKTPCASKMK